MLSLHVFASSLTTKLMLFNLNKYWSRLWKCCCQKLFPFLFAARCYECTTIPLSSNDMDNNNNNTKKNRKLNAIDKIHFFGRRGKSGGVIEEQIRRWNRKVKSLAILGKNPLLNWIKTFSMRSILWLAVCTNGEISTRKSFSSFTPEPERVLLNNSPRKTQIILRTSDLSRIFCSCFYFGVYFHTKKCIH